MDGALVSVGSGVAFHPRGGEHYPARAIGAVDDDGVIGDVELDSHLGRLGGDDAHCRAWLEVVKRA